MYVMFWYTSGAEFWLGLSNRSGQLGILKWSWKSQGMFQIYMIVNDCAKNLNKCDKIKQNLIPCHILLNHCKP